MSERNVSVAFVELADLGIALGAAPLIKHPDCWEHQIDKQWWVAINGHGTERKTSHGGKVPAYSAYVEFNGWPFGILNPYEGCMGAGEAANEDTLIAAIRAAKEAPHG